MKATIYHNPRCSKSRQGLEIAKGLTEELVIREYLKEPLNTEELSRIIDKLGISAQALIRTGEADYKTHFKGRELTEAEWIQAMVDYPKLMERPIVETQNQAVVGRPPENISSLF